MCDFKYVSFQLLEGKLVVVVVAARNFQKNCFQLFKNLLNNEITYDTTNQITICDD